MIKELKNHIIFVYGLPDIGKSLEINNLYQKDNQNDLLLSCSGNKNHTHNYIRIRNHKNLSALGITLADNQRQQTDLCSYLITMYKQPNRVMVDEAEDASVKELRTLLNNLVQLFPNAEIILFGVLIDNENNYFASSKYLVDNFQHFNYNPTCKFCNRKAQFMLNVYHGKPISYHYIHSLSKSKQKKIERHLYRYHVCAYHLHHVKKVDNL